MPTMLEAMVRVRAWVSLVMIAGLVGCTEPRDGGSAFEPVTPCPFEAARAIDSARLECGYLKVPERRDTANGRTIRVPVAVIRSEHAEPRPDPVVFLHGGPGGAPLSSERVYELFARHAFGSNRDIVLYNQRGSLMTEPALHCDGMQELRLQAVAADLSLAELNATLAQAARDCLAGLLAAGHELHGYSARENAFDLLDLRHALGVSQWNLMAVSYGTLMSLEAARVDPQGVRSLVLDSIVSYQSDLFMSEGNRNFARALQRLLEACAANEACNAAYPHLADTLSELLGSLQTHPLRLAFEAGEPGAAMPVLVNWHDFLSVVHWMLYNSETLRLVPMLIAETHDGNDVPMRYLMERVYPGPQLQQESAAGAFLAIVCRDQFTDRVPASLPQAFDGFSMAGFLQETCADPAFGYAATPAYQPFETAVPALLLSGYFDPTTPDLYAEQAAGHMTHGEAITIANFGHSTLSGYTACQTDLAAAFLNEPGPMAAYPCLQTLQGPDFIVTPADAPW